MIVFLTTLLILLCLAVVLLILIQRTSGGMGSALGGGATDQYLGAGSAAQLSKLTVWCRLTCFINNLNFALAAQILTLNGSVSSQGFSNGINHVRLGRAIVLENGLKPAQQAQRQIVRKLAAPDMGGAQPFRIAGLRHQGRKLVR